MHVCDSSAPPPFISVPSAQFRRSPTETFFMMADPTTELYFIGSIVDSTELGPSTAVARSAWSKRTTTRVLPLAPTCSVDKLPRASFGWALATVASAATANVSADAVCAYPALSSIATPASNPTASAHALSTSDRRVWPLQATSSLIRSIMRPPSFVRRSHHLGRAPDEWKLVCAGRTVRVAARTGRDRGSVDAQCCGVQAKQGGDWPILHGASRQTPIGPVASWQCWPIWRHSAVGAGVFISEKSQPAAKSAAASPIIRVAGRII